MELGIVIAYLEKVLEKNNNQLIVAKKSSCKKRYIDFLNIKSNQFRNALEILKQKENE